MKLSFPYSSIGFPLRWEKCVLPYSLKQLKAPRQNTGLLICSKRKTEDKTIVASNAVFYADFSA